MANQRKKIEVLRDLGSYKAGQTVSVDVDGNGVPTDRFWRRRIRDNDGFCKFQDEKSAKPAGKKAADKSSLDQE